jgi:hypothetical protein
MRSCGGITFGTQRGYNLNKRSWRSCPSSRPAGEHQDERNS